MTAMAIDSKHILEFLHRQVTCWNAGDKKGFFDTYRKAAPARLAIEYVGQAPADGWLVLEAMWERQNQKIEIEEVALIVNGNEAACHNHNKVRGTDIVIDTIELYRFDVGGNLEVRYFIRQP